MTTISIMPSSDRPIQQMRFKMGAIVLTPENRVAIVCGQMLQPEGLMAFVVEAHVPPHKRRSKMVPYHSLRPAPCGGPVLAVDNGNRRNPFAPSSARPEASNREITGHAHAFLIVDELPAVDAAQPAPALEAFFTPPPRPAQAKPPLADTPIPAFLRKSWRRDLQGRRLAPYPPLMAALALWAFKVWPARAARVFDAWRLVEAARQGAVACGREDQTLLARIASGWSGRP